MPNISIKDAANLTIFKGGLSGKKWIYSPFATVTTQEQKVDTVYSKAKTNNAISFESNFSTTLKITLEVFDKRMLSILFGNDIQVGICKLYKREVLTVGAGNKVTVAKTPNANSLQVFTLENDLITSVVEITPGTPASAQNTYSISGNDITLNSTSQPPGTKIEVIYICDTEATANYANTTVVNNMGNVAIVYDLMTKDMNGTIGMLQKVFGNCKIQRNATLTMDASNIMKLELNVDVFEFADSFDSQLKICRDVYY